MFFRITSVDEWGFQGRERHPVKSDEGLIVCAIGMFATYEDQHAFAPGAMLFPEVMPDPERPRFDGLSIAGDERRAVIARAFDNPFAGPHDPLLRCWVCVTREGRVLNLLDHEIEPVTLARDIRESRDRCPGCGCEPGDVKPADCDDPNGCGFWKQVGR